jgi:hypothetical protein
MSKQPCYFCKKNINEKQDPYCLLISVNNSDNSDAETLYLRICDCCFDENADLKIKKRLKEINNSYNWKICPYCLEKPKSSHFQVAKIHNSGLQNARLCTKCYHINIDIPREYFYE